MTRWGLRSVLPTLQGFRSQCFAKETMGLMVVSGETPGQTDGYTMGNWRVKIMCSATTEQASFDKMAEEDREEFSEQPTHSDSVSQRVPAVHLLCPSSGICNCFLFLKNSRKGLRQLSLSSFSSSPRLSGYFFGAAGPWYRPDASSSLLEKLSK